MSALLDHLSDSVKHAVDVLSVGALVGVLLSWLPHITALLVAAWTILRIYETMLNVRIARKKLRGD